MKAIDDGLLALGHSVRKAIYWHLESEHGLKREEIPEKLEDFALALSALLGEGAKVLLKVMAKRLYARLELNFEEKPGWSFKNYVEEAMKQEIK